MHRFERGSEHRLLPITEPLLYGPSVVRQMENLIHPTGACGRHVRSMLSHAPRQSRPDMDCHQHRMAARLTLNQAPLPLSAIEAHCTQQARLISRSRCDSCVHTARCGGIAADVKDRYPMDHRVESSLVGSGRVVKGNITNSNNLWWRPKSCGQSLLLGGDLAARCSLFR